MNYLFRVVVGSLCAYLAKKIDRAEIIRKLYYIYKTKCNID